MKKAYPDTQNDCLVAFNTNDWYFVHIGCYWNLSTQNLQLPPKKDLETEMCLKPVKVASTTAEASERTPFNENEAHAHRCAYR